MAKKAPFFLHKFSLPVMTLLADAVEMALAQSAIDRIPPGHIALEPKERGGGDYAYWVRFEAGKPVRRYLGPRGSEPHLAGEAALAEMKRLQGRARELRKLGFEAVEHDAALVIAELANSGIFNGGGILVGTRAFGSILNHLGYKATPFLGTHDVDIARFGAIKLATPLPTGGFVELLKQTGLRFAPVLGLERPPGPPTSYKVVGKDLKVVLLAPSRLASKPYETIPVAELDAHATTLPFLDYLIDDSWRTIVIGRDHLIPVRVPQPARYCLHKLAVADLRFGADNPKIEKDVIQAGILAAILVPEDPSALEDAAAAIPESMRKHVKKAFLKTRAALEHEHPEALSFLEHLIQGVK